MADETKDDSTTHDPSADDSDTASARLMDARQRFATVADGLGERVKSVSETAKKRGSRFSRHGAAIGRRALSSASSVGSKARERYGDKVVYLQQGYTQTRDHALGWSDEIADFVRASPGRAVLGAVLAGFLVGMVTRRR